MRGGGRARCFDGTGMEFMRAAQLYDEEIEVRNANVE